MIGPVEPVDTLATVTDDVSARLPTVAITRKVPADAPAVNSPAAVIVPPVAVNTAPTSPVVLSSYRPVTVNCSVPPDATEAVAGVRATCTSAGAATTTTAVSARVPETLAATT